MQDAPMHDSIPILVPRTPDILHAARVCQDGLLSMGPVIASSIRGVEVGLQFGQLFGIRKSSQGVLE